MCKFNEIKSIRFLSKIKLKRGFMKKLISLYILGCIFAAPISEELAVNVAENFYFSKNDPRENTFSIESIAI